MPMGGGGRGREEKKRGSVGEGRWV